MREGLEKAQRHVTTYSLKNGGNRRSSPRDESQQKFGCSLARHGSNSGFSTVGSVKTRQSLSKLVKIGKNRIFRKGRVKPQNGLGDIQRIGCP